MSLRPPVPVPPIDPSWTRRQREVLDLLVRGRSNAEIAEALGVTLAGAKWHVSEILSKLDVQTREEAAEYWRAQNGLRPRFSRLVRGALPASAWSRWLAGGVASGIGIAAAAIVVAAVVSDGASSPADPGDATQTPPPPTTAATPDPSATPPPGTLLARPVACADPNEDISCQLARQIEEYLRRAAIDAIMALAKPTATTCPGPVAGGLGGPYPLCDGARPGEVRDGYPITLHGSHGGLVTVAEFRRTIAELAAAQSWAVGRGCLATDFACGQFAISFVLSALPQLFYFTFQRGAADSASITGLGRSGDNADDILNGRPTRTQLDDGQTSTVFQPFPTSGELIGELRSLYLAHSAALVTSVSPLDATLKALVPPNPEAIAALGRPTVAACILDDGRAAIHAPAICGPGRPVGASVPASLIGGCAERDGYGAIAPALDLAAYVSFDLFRFVQAVIRTSVDPRVKYIVIVANGEKGITLLLDDRGIVGIGGGGCGQGPFNEMAARAEDFAVPPRPARSLGFIPRSIQVTLSGHAAARGNDLWGSCDSLRGSEGVPSAGAWCFESVTLHGQGRATAIVRPVSSASATSIELQLIDDDEWRAIRETARP